MKVETTQDNLAAVMKSIKDLVSQDVLVGIPAANASRDNSGPINNAALGYVHEFGSPAQGIPPRPFLIPGVTKAEDGITDQMKQAGKAALNFKPAGVQQALMKAGEKAVSSAKAVMTAGEGYEPLKPSTIANRYRQRGTISMRKGEKAYLALKEQGGMSEQDMQSAAGIKPLINTGQLRNSLTYVIRKK